MQRLLNEAPVALIMVDDQDVIVDQNLAAKAMGFRPGASMTIYTGLKEPFIRHLANQPHAHIYTMVFEGGEKRCRAIPAEAGAGLGIWLLDMSEQLALGEQIRKLRQPGLNQLRQVNQLTVAAMGYAELLDLMMTDLDVLTTDRLARLRHYQSEVARSLRTIQRVINGETMTGRRGTVLVADRHQALTELITELLRSEGYRVVCFSDAGSVIRYCQVNGHTLQKAVVDEALCDDSAQPLIKTLREQSPDLSIVVLSEAGSGGGKGYVPKPLDFRVLLDSLAEDEPDLWS